MTLTDITDGADGPRIHITLGPLATLQAVGMARRMGCTVAEIVRRSMSLYRTWMNLPGGDMLAILRASGDIERLVLEHDSRADDAN